MVAEMSRLILCLRSGHSGRVGSSIGVPLGRRGNSPAATRADHEICESATLEYDVGKMDYRNLNRSLLPVVTLLVAADAAVCVMGIEVLVGGHWQLAWHLRQSSCRYHIALERSSSDQQKDSKGLAYALLLT